MRLHPLMRRALKALLLSNWRYSPLLAKTSKLLSHRGDPNQSIITVSLHTRRCTLASARQLNLKNPANEEVGDPSGNLTPVKPLARESVEGVVILDRMAFRRITSYASSCLHIVPAVQCCLIAGRCLTSDTAHCIKFRTSVKTFNRTECVVP